MQISVRNNIRVRGAPTPLVAEITKALTIDNPEYVERKKKRRPTWGVKPKLELYSREGPDLILPRGYLSELLQLADGKQADISYQYTDARPIDFGEWNPKFALQPDQLPAVEAIIKQNGILVAPAGSGKTVMGMRYVYEKGLPALWLTHTKDLLYQSKEKAEKTMLGVGKVGVIGDGIQDWGDGKLFIATVQTLNSNEKLIETLNSLVGTVVADECHHIVTEMFINVIGRFSAPNMLGVTATPNRKDKLEAYMYRTIGPELYRIDRANLYETGRLIKPEIKFVYTDFNFEQASDRNSINSVDAGGEELDYRALMDALIADEPRATLVANTVLDHKGFAIVISESIRYCHKLKNIILQQAKSRGLPAPRIAVAHGTLQRYGWRVARNEREAIAKVNSGEAKAYKYDCKSRRFLVQIPNYTDIEYQDYQVSPAERKQIISDAATGKLDILIASTIAKEGLDLPNLSVGVLATPQRGDAGAANGIGVEQTIGRIQRPDPNNPDKKAVWIDIVDAKVGVLKSQYYSRRSVYKRLGLQVPNKPKTDRDDIEAFLKGMKF